MKKHGLFVLVLLILSISMMTTFADTDLEDPSALFQNHDSVMLIIDASTGAIVDANSAAEKFYGYSVNELRKMRISDINVLSDEEVGREMALALQEKRNYFEFRHQLKDGSIRDVEVYSSPAADTAGHSLLFSIVHDITEKKTAEAEAHKNKERVIYLLGILTVILFISIGMMYRAKVVERNNKNKFRSIFDNMHEGFALHEIVLNDEGCPVDYRFLDSNAAFEKITGRPLDAIRNKTVKEVFPMTEQYWIDNYGDVAINGKTMTFSNYSAALDKYFNVNVYSPSPKLFATIFSDVTLEMKAQIKIEKERNILETILEDTLAGYWDWDLINDTEYLSPSFKTMLGYRDDELENRPESWQRIIFEEDLPKVLELFDKHIDSKGEVPFYNEIRYHHKSGSTVWVICSGRVIQWDGHRPVRMVGCHIDITKIKRLEHEIRDERALFETTLHSIGDGVISTDAHGNVDIMNAEAERLTGWTNAEAAGRPFKNIFYTINESTGEPRGNIQEKIAETMTPLELGNNTLLIKRSGEEVPIEASAAPIQDGKGNMAGLVVVFRDCSEKKEKQEKIEYLSYHDQLTSLYNRHFYEEALKRLDLERNLPFTVAMIDVNGLKLTNDAFGHETGDLLLVRIAEALKKQCRTDDIVSRVGGDEFVILLPKTSYDEAETIVRRIYKAIASVKIDNIVASVSIGWETKETADQDIKEVVTRAEDFMYRKKITESQSMHNKTIKVIMQTLHEANPREKIHSERVSKLSRKIGEALELDHEVLKELETTGLVHDIGKIAIDNTILNKPGKLTEPEYEVIKKHPEISYHILKSADGFTRFAEHVLSHHERWDGNGYPRGLAGEEIPLVARIITIADAYEAMTAVRPYKESLTHTEAVDELKRFAGSQFDPAIVATFEEFCILEETQGFSGL